MFYTLLTNIGKAKLANATALGTTVQLTHIAVGDGNGSAITPVDTATVLMHEVWRAALNSIAVDPANANWIVAEGYIPSTSGGFTVREVGLFDIDGDLIAIGSYPDTYKPTLASGSAKDLYIKVIIEVTNSSTVTLKIDPAVVLSTRGYVDSKVTEHEGKSNPHPQYMTATAVQSAFNEISTRENNHIPLSGFASYHLLSGSLQLQNTVITTGFSTYLYTGNTTTPPSVNLGVDIESQWGDNVDEKFGFLLVFKSRSAIGDWTYVDSVRGNTKYVSSNTTAAEGTDTNMFTLNTVGGVTTVTMGSSTRTNSNGVTYMLEVYQTTHRKTGSTNQNKAYTCHYNPASGFTIDKYEGSGVAGNGIPHHLGRKLELTFTKNLGNTTDWYAGNNQSIMNLNLSNAASALTSAYWSNTDTDYVTGSQSYNNQSGYQHILYGWANSYFDEAGTLHGIFEIDLYQGSGAAGNKVTMRGKLAMLEVKRLDSAASWFTFDNLRGGTKYLNADSTQAEPTLTAGLTFDSSSFSMNETGSALNASGGQYLYFAVYDNDSGSGKSKYPRATDTSNLNLNAIVPFANGADSVGAKNAVLSKNETVSGLTYTEGKNYVYGKNDGTYGVTAYPPSYGKTNPANGGDFYNVLKNKWYTSAGAEITESRNYLDAIVYAYAGGQPTYVEQLPKTQYFDEVKANEFKGKNACTAWVNFDGTTTPPTIRDSYNVKSVIRTATGLYEIYFESPMDNASYSVACFGVQTWSANNTFLASGGNIRNTNKFSLFVFNSTWATQNMVSVEVQIFGGKN